MNIMHYGEWGFMGMHALWWVFWIILIVVFVGFMTSSLRGQASDRETPLEILRRRYAKGEISSEEYEERKAKLEGDHQSSA
jgi:putative membrane protein